MKDLSTEKSCAGWGGERMRIRGAVDIRAGIAYTSYRAIALKVVGTIL